MKRYLWGELFLGVLLVAVSFLFDGVILFALGGCTIGLAAQCSVHSRHFQFAAIGLGIVSVLILVTSCISSFFALASTGGYDRSSSPLVVLLILSVLFLVQSFLLLPLEDRWDLDMLRRGVRAQSVFVAMGLGGILLNYLLSYLLQDVFLTNLLEQDNYYASGEGGVPVALQDFHYIEGLIAFAVCATVIRSVVRAFMGKEPLGESEKEIAE